MVSIRTVTPETAAQIMGQDDVMILDCRDVGDYRESHIEGAMHSHDDLVEGLIRKGDKSRTLLVYCYTGHRSEHLTEFLTQFGFSNACNLTGGYQAWQTWSAQQTA